MICTIWTKTGDSWPNSTHRGCTRGCLFPFLELKNKSCKIMKKHCKIHGFGLGRVQGGAKTCSKSCLRFTLKILQKPCKTQGFRHQASTTKRAKKHVSVLCGQKTYPKTVHVLDGLSIDFVTTLGTFWSELEHGRGAWCSKFAPKNRSKRTFSEKMMFAILALVGWFSDPSWFIPRGFWWQVKPGIC